jgi:putative transposase
LIRYQVEAGRSTEDVAREVGRVQAHDLCPESKVWRLGSKRGATLEATEDENGQLKKLVADLSLDKEMLRAVIKKTD